VLAYDLLRVGPTVGYCTVLYVQCSLWSPAFPNFVPRYESPCAPLGGWPLARTGTPVATGSLTHRASGQKGVSDIRSYYNIRWLFAVRKHLRVILGCGCYRCVFALLGGLSMTEICVEQTSIFTATQGAGNSSRARIVIIACSHHHLPDRYAAMRRQSA
jgi:hypothetical protein